MAVSKLTIIVGIFATLCSYVLAYAPGRHARLREQVDIYNATALHEYRLALRQKHFSQRSSCAPGLLSNNFAGRFEDPFGGISLKSRQSCIGNQKNYCFGTSSTQYCDDCGICCTQSAGPWCCITNGGSVVKTCCPADTGLANGQQGCCFTWQTCDSTTGCTDPSTTITTTITSWSTVYTTSTSTDTQYTTSVIISSLWSTAWTTVSNAQTATEVIRTTLSSAKQRRTVAAEYDGETRTIQPTSSEQDQHPRPHTIATDSVQVPVVTLLTYAEYDSVARDLQNLGVIVKRQTTITSTSTAYTSATTTVQSVEVSSELLTVWVTSTTHLITTKTTYVDAQVTVSVTSTITPPEPTSTSSSPTTSPSSSQPITSSPSTGNGPPSSAGAAPVSATSTTPAVGAGGGGGGLSKGAEVGIGVGTAAGSLIICTIILFWWRRRRRHPDKQGNDPSSPMAPAGGFHSQSEQKSELPGNHAMQENYPQMYPYSPNSAGTGYGAPLPAYHDGYAPNGPVPAEAPAHEQYTPQHQNQGQRPQSFQYAPYELYDERPQELYNHRYERGLRLSEAE